MSRHALGRLLVSLFVLSGVFSLWPSMAEAQLDGVWRRDDGQTIEISGSTGVFRAFSSVWQDYVDAGLVRLGDAGFRNISPQTTNKWSYDHLWGRRESDIPVYMHWSVEGTLTLSSDGRTLTAWSRTEDGGTGTFTYTREDTSTSDWDVRVGHNAGTISKQQPVFGWRYQDWAPTWTQAWINRDGQTYWTPWIQHSSATVGQELRWTPSQSLPPGRYTFWMRGWSASQGYGTWSQSGSFTIALPTPQAVTLLSPSGEQSGADHTLRWRKDGNATYYQVYMARGGTQVFSRWYEMSGTGDASVNLSGFAAGSTYTWWVRPWSPGGYGPWSSPMTFSIASAAPAAAVLTHPMGNITNVRPEFRWNQAARAEYYHLYVTRGGRAVIDQWVQSTAVTPSSNLSDGTYTWWVGAWNSATRRTVWSDRATFTLGSGDDTTPVTTYESRAHQLVNNYRTANGRQAVVSNSQLTLIARQHSQAAANGTITQSQFLAHHGADGRYDQAKSVMTWSSAAENVGYNRGYADPPLVVFDGWRNSAGHNEAMLNGTFTHTGLGAARGADGTWYFTQLFFRSP